MAQMDPLTVEALKLYLQDRHPDNHVLKTYEIPWEDLTEKEGLDPHEKFEYKIPLWKRRDVNIFRVEFFIGTFSEQWNEIDLNATLLTPWGTKAPLCVSAPHKHGGTNLVDGPGAGEDGMNDQKVIPGWPSEGAGGVYYDAIFKHEIGRQGRGIWAGRGSQLLLEGSMAETGRGAHLGVRVYGNIESYDWKLDE